MTEENIIRLVEAEALEILIDNWRNYKNPKMFSSISFEEVLDSASDYLETKRIRCEANELNQKNSR